MFTILRKIFLAIMLISLGVLVTVALFSLISSSVPDDTTVLETFSPGWATAGDSAIYIDQDLKVATGWKKIDDRYYYFDEEGHPSKGRLCLEGKVYTFDQKGFLTDSIVEFEGKTLYVGKDGLPHKGWVSYGGKKYYSEEDGSLRTGWMNVDGKKYYLSSDGSVMTGPSTVNGVLYTFGRDGALITEEELLAEINKVSSGPENKTPSDNVSRYILPKNASGNEINPIELTALGGLSLSSTDETKIKDSIKETAEGRYTLGIICMNLDTGAGFSYNMDEVFYTASSIKGPFISGLVSNYPEVIENQQKAISAILINSDNDLFQGLRHRYGRDCMKDWFDKAGFGNEIWWGDYANLTAAQLAKLWIQSYYFFLQDENGKKLAPYYEIPNRSTINKNLKKDGYITRTKGGWISGKYNTTTDAGIVYPSAGSPYLLVICSNIPDNMDKLDKLTQILGNTIESY